MSQGSCEDGTYREMFIALLRAVREEFGGKPCSSEFQATMRTLGEWYVRREGQGTRVFAEGRPVRTDPAPRGRIIAFRGPELDGRPYAKARDRERD